VTRDAFLAQIEAEGIRRDSFGLGEDVNEAYCLLAGAEWWELVYSERGQHRLIGYFATESDGLERLLRVLRSDGAVGS